MVGEQNVEISLLFRFFELASDLKVNFFKSKVVGIGVDEASMRRYAKVLNCEIMKTRFIYLGIPIGANHRRASTWEPIVQKFKNKWSTWKGRLDGEVDL